MDKAAGALLTAEQEEETDLSIFGSQVEWSPVAVVCSQYICSILQ